MSSADLTKPLSVRTFLFGGATDTVELLSRSLSEQGVSQSAIQGFRSLSGSALQTVNREIVTVADGFLNLDLRDVLLSGWHKSTPT